MIVGPKGHIITIIAIINGKSFFFEASGNKTLQLVVFRPVSEPFHINLVVGPVFLDYMQSLLDFVRQIMVMLGGDYSILVNCNFL